MKQLSARRRKSKAHSTLGEGNELPCLRILSNHFFQLPFKSQDNNTSFEVRVNNLQSKAVIKHSPDCSPAWSIVYPIESVANHLPFVQTPPPPSAWPVRGYHWLWNYTTRKLYWCINKQRNTNGGQVQNLHLLHGTDGQGTYSAVKAADPTLK